MFQLGGWDFFEFSNLTRYNFDLGEDTKMIFAERFQTRKYSAWKNAYLLSLFSDKENLITIYFSLKLFLVFMVKPIRTAPYFKQIWFIMTFARMRFFVILVHNFCLSDKLVLSTVFTTKISPFHWLDSHKFEIVSTFLLSCALLYCAYVVSIHINSASSS